MPKENLKAIETLITNYFEGIFFGDVIKLEACFNKEVTIYGDIKGVVHLKNLNDYLKEVKNRQSPKGLNELLTMKIISIEIIGEIAMAKLNVPMLGYNYYDYLSLVKINMDWRIVNKIFTHVE